MLGSAWAARDCRRHKRHLLSLDVVSEQRRLKTALAERPPLDRSALWRSEFRNIVALAIRKKTLTINAAQEIVRKVGGNFERGEFTVASDAVLQLVARSNCTAYDCEFVALAHAEGVQLVTIRSPDPARISRGRHFVEKIRARLSFGREPLTPVLAIAT